MLDYFGFKRYILNILRLHTKPIYAIVPIVKKAVEFPLSTHNTVRWAVSKRWT